MASSRKNHGRKSTEHPSQSLNSNHRRSFPKLAVALDLQLS